MVRARTLGKGNDKIEIVPVGRLHKRMTYYVLFKETNVKLWQNRGITYKVMDV